VGADQSVGATTAKTPNADTDAPLTTQQKHRLIITGWVFVMLRSGQRARSGYHILQFSNNSARMPTAGSSMIKLARTSAADLQTTK